MSVMDLEYLLNLNDPAISKTDTIFKRAVSTKDRLLVTLHFLATGDSYASLKYLFRISTATICYIIPDVCAAIIECLQYYVQV
nr:unnamed protein product [Callosobruchus analis]